MDEPAIICIMDMGNRAALVYRDDRKARFVPLTIVGHRLKESWGLYYRLRRLGKAPRSPGM